MAVEPTAGSGSNREGEPTLRELLLGEFDERVVAESLGPVVVVRRLEEDGA